MELLLSWMRADPRFTGDQETYQPHAFIRPPRNELSPPPPFREDEDVIVDFGEDESELVVEEDDDAVDPDEDDSFGNTQEEEEGEQPGGPEEPGRSEEVTAEGPSAAPDDASDTSSNDYDPDIDPKRWARRLNELAGIDEMNERELDSYKWGPPAFHNSESLVLLAAASANPS